jgi:SAM-dependent methyltransferase
MHAEAFRYVSQFATRDALSVIEIGSRDINGTPRPFFPAASWIGLDLHPGPCVDWVGDCLDYEPTSLVDLVVTTEVLEHAEQWRHIIHKAARWLKPGGRMIITAAGPGRAPHSHHDGGGLRDGEYYGNLSASQIAEELHFAGMIDITTEEHPSRGDTYAIAMKALGPSS